MLLSVIVPIYNVEDYLDECVFSLINQKLRELEIILVDDGSTDLCGEKCDYYTQIDQRVKVIHKENGGLVSARKAGVKAATGKYIACVDGDDWIDCNMYYNMFESIKEENVDVIQCGFIIEADSTIIKSNKSNVFHLEEERENLIIEWLQGKENVGSQIFNKIYERGLFEQAYNNVPDYMSNGEDYIYFIHMIKSAKKIKTISEALYHYRVREDSLSHNMNGVELLLKEDKLTEYIYYCIKRIFADVPLDILENWVIERKRVQLRRNIGATNKVVDLYSFEDINMLMNKRIIIYGAGKMGIDFIKELAPYESIQIVGWVDRNCDSCSNDYRKVECVETIRNKIFDYIIVAINDYNVAESVCDYLVKAKLTSSDKIIWNYNRKLTSYMSIL